MANITSIFVFMLCGWCKNCKDKTNSLFTSCFFQPSSVRRLSCCAKLVFCILAQEMAGPAIRNSGKKSNTIEGDKKKLQVENIILDIVVAAIVFLEIARMYFDRMPAISRRKRLLFFGRHCGIMWFLYLIYLHHMRKKHVSSLYNLMHTHTLFHSILVSFEILFKP